MKKKTIKKTIDIKASKENVWRVLFEDKFTRVWYNEFCEGAYAETDWKIGSKALFKDESESGMAGKVIVNKPNEKMSIEYEGIVIAGVEDYDTEGAKNVRGGRETYMLSEKDGVTKVSIECDMAPEYFESMSSSWEKALQKIKLLSEAKIKKNLLLAGNHKNILRKLD